jgi:AAA15 family ATPase/GTPase
MISSFFIRNYRSIQELKVDFSFSEGKAPNGHLETENYHFFCPSSLKNDKRRYVACLAFYGANASGKSNILNALRDFRKLTVVENEDKFDIKNKLERLFYPNRLNKKFSTTTFEMTFFAEQREYSYRIEYDNQEIKEETLLKNGETLFLIKKQIRNFEKIATKEYSAELLQTTFEVECLDNKIYQRQPFLLKLRSRFPGLSRDVCNAFDYIDRIIMFGNNNPKELGLRRDIDNFHEDFSKMVEVVKKLDVDLSRVGISMLNDPKAKGKGIGKIKTYHKDINNDEIEFDFIDESRGTQILLGGLISWIRVAIEGGRPLIVDELDASLHPLLLKEIIYMFKNKSYNPQKAQIIFSTHTTDILDYGLLKVSDVAIVDKTLQSGTTIKRLCDFDGIRNTTDFRKQYLEGRFSGIPFSYI